MIKKLFFVLLFAISYLFSTTFVYGKDFSSFYKTTYEIDEKGQAFITQEVSLINETPDLYVSEYSLSLSGGGIENIEAYDKIGPLKIKTEKNNDSTIIYLTFNDKSVGKGKILSFILKYKTNGLVKKTGNLWEIAIPKLGNSQEIDDFQLSLKVPVSFGKIGSVNPRPISIDKYEKYYQLNFSKNDLLSFGILAVFGHYQTFDFKITYNLKNNSAEFVSENIALPPDTNYQEVYYESLTPKPKNVEVDTDGNWIALYEIPPSSEIRVEAGGKAIVFSQPQNKPPIKLANLDLYTKAEKYWETNDEEIKTLAQKLKTPRKIYDFVVEKLSYDYEQINNKIIRKGAAFAFQNPSKSLCTSFTDLFVALCRSAGIPAREMEGFAYSENPKINDLFKNEDVLHSWPQFYDEQKKQWIMVDPTFAKTSGGLDFFSQFDMTHFVFAIHGVNSDFPYPAGSYKGTSLEKQIQVNFGEDFVKNDFLQIAIENISPKKIFTLKRNTISADISNVSGSAVYDKKLVLKSNGEVFPNEWQIEVIPPFGRFKIVSSLKPIETFFDHNSKSFFSIDNISFAFDQRVISSLIRLFIVLGSIVSIIIFVILMSLRKRKNK